MSGIQRYFAATKRDQFFLNIFAFFAWDHLDRGQEPVTTSADVKCFAPVHRGNMQAISA